MEWLHENTAENFEGYADGIMNGCVITIGGEWHRILELEFYLHNAEHPDPYVHRNPQQLTVGQWYFHRTGNSYKGGTYKGLDITFGADSYGGILIRTLLSP